MKSRTEEQKLTEAQAKKPRFMIEKLEERIAPRHARGRCAVDPRDDDLVCHGGRRFR